MALPSNGKNPAKRIKTKYNLVSRRGDPKEAKLQSGHTVHKSEYLYFTEPDDGAKPEHPIAVEAAEYHGEHFLYVDPLYEGHGPESIGRWFAMCTCGSHAVIIDASDADRLRISHKGKSIAVCWFYTDELHRKGEHRAGHVTSYVNKKDHK